MYALQGEGTDIGNVRETFFYNQMRVNYEIVSSKITDFRIGEHIFEIGGSKKGNANLTETRKGLLSVMILNTDMLHSFLFGTSGSHIDRNSKKLFGFFRKPKF